jgi:sec-independent protein translocase protein TatB
VFDSIGWAEIVVLGLAALFIFGPERLPHLVQDAAAGLKRLRGAMTGMQGQLHDTLGPDLDHLKGVDLRQYHPRSLLRRALIDQNDDPSGQAAETTAHLAAGRARVARPQEGLGDDDAG